MKKKKKTKKSNELLKSWLGQLLLKLTEIHPRYIVESAIRQENSLTHKHKQKLGQIKSYRLVPLLVVILIAAAVLWSSASLSNAHYKVDSATINANQSNSALLGSINKLVNRYSLTISYPNGTLKKYPLASLGLTLNQNKTLNNFISAKNNLANRLRWWRPVSVNLVFNKDASTFNSFIATSTQIVVEPSTDASISLSSGQISITNAITGKEYGLVNSTNSLYSAAVSLNPAPIKLKTLAVNPAITAATLQPYKSQLEKVLNQTISFSIGDKTLSPSPSQIAGWLDISPDDKSKKLLITANSGKVLAYLDSISAPYTIPPKAQVNVTSSDGSSQVLVPGVNGEVVSGENDIATSVAKNLLQGTGQSESLSVTYKPFETITAGNYPKWIEVDLTNKRLYAYENNNLVNTYLVTAGAPATPTVTGQYAIYAKYLSQNMSGENVDGSSYYQPNVPWINYFYSDYAIHGNYWRPLSYFGNINSSHGCVGLVDANAEWVYNWAPIGTPVIIHY